MAVGKSPGVTPPEGQYLQVVLAEKVHDLQPGFVSVLWPDIRGLRKNPLVQWVENRGVGHPSAIALEGSGTLSRDDMK